MHFSIPDTQEFIDGAGNAYVGYNIHINGIFHCTVRYKQLHNLHEQLTKELDVSLPTFPPKKFFPLTITQQEERRLSLEKYIQTVGQNIIITNSGMLSGFLLNAQQETIGGPSDNENLDVFLMNGSKITITVSTGEHSGHVLKKVCQHIKLVEQYHPYFALFIINQEGNDNISLLRKLQDFESPFITNKNICAIGTRIVLGKNYWDIAYDLDLVNDPVALNLLYIQAVAEIHRGWILVTDKIKNHLTSLQDDEKKREYLDIARTLKYYGYIKFAPCFCDYPQPNTKVLVAIGRNELNLRILSHQKEDQEAVFKVPRMRCWRITTLQNAADRCEENNDISLELSFEYLIARNHLHWITIISEQAILMSVCLQSMIDELLLKCVGGNNVQDTTGKSWTYITRDGDSCISIGSTSSTCNVKCKKTESPNSSVKPDPIIKKIADRLSAVRLRKSDDAKAVVHKPQRQCSAEYDVMENNAFRMIGDDDL
ncbi:hypothetical protein KM043_017960 [Ampulex compressa]|nr:hypothetical protein KM043_017960 [Ampulex compressa]